MSNGLLLCLDKTDSDFVTISYNINAGSFDEPEDMLGVAHLSEHLVFKGTLNRTTNEIFSDIEILGGEINAYTTETNICFYVTILKEYWENALDILFDIVWNNTIPEEEFEREKSVVIEELKMYHDDGKRRIFDLLTKTAYCDVINKWNNGGTPKTVTAINRDQVEYFIDNFYVPENMQIFVTGGIDEQKIKEKIEWYFKEININSNHDNFRDDTIEPQVKSLAEEIDSTQSHMVMYLAIDNAKTTKEYFIQEMAKDIFGNGFGSRLMEIREKYGYAYTIYCDHIFSQPKSLLYVYIGLNKENIANTQKLMINKLNEIASGSITEKEFFTAKNGLLTTIKSNKISTSAMNDMRINFLNEQLDFDWDIQKLIDEVNTITVQDIENYYHTLNIENVGFITLNQTKD